MPLFTWFYGVVFGLTAGTSVAKELERIIIVALWKGDSFVRSMQATRQTGGSESAVRSARKSVGEETKSATPFTNSPNLRRRPYGPFGRKLVCNHPSAIPLDVSARWGLLMERLSGEPYATPCEVLR